MRKPFSKFGVLFSKTKSEENNQKNAPNNGYVKYLLRKEQDHLKKSGKSKRKQNSIEAIPSFHNNTSKKQRGKPMNDRKCLDDIKTRKARSKAKEDALVRSGDNPNVLFISPEDIVTYKKHLKKFKNNTADVLHKAPQLKGKKHDRDFEDVIIFNSVKEFGRFKNRLPSPEVPDIKMARTPGKSSRAKHFPQRRSSETNDGNWLSKKKPLKVNDNFQHIINYNFSTEPAEKCAIIGGGRNIHRQNKESNKHGKDTKKQHKTTSSKHKFPLTKSHQGEKKPQTARHKLKTEASNPHQKPKNTNRKVEPDLKEYIGNFQGIFNRNLFSFLKDLPQDPLGSRKDEEPKHQKDRHHKHKSEHKSKRHHHKTEPTKLDKTELIKQYLRNHSFGEGAAQSKLSEHCRKPFVKNFPNWNSKDHTPVMNCTGENNVHLDKSYNEKTINQLLENLDSTGCLVRKVCPVLEIIPIKSLDNRTSRQLSATYSQVLEKKKHTVAFRNYYRYTSQMTSSISDSNRMCQDVSEPSVDSISEIQKTSNRFQSKIPLLKVHDFLKIPVVNNSRAPVVSPRNKFAASNTKSLRTPPSSKTSTAVEPPKPNLIKSKTVGRKLIGEVEKMENSIQTDSEKQESKFKSTKRSTGRSPRTNQKVIASKRSFQSQLSKSRDTKRSSGATVTFDQSKRSSLATIRKPIRIAKVKSEHYDNESQANEKPPSIKSINTSISNVTREQRSSGKIFDDNRKAKTASVSFTNHGKNVIKKASVVSNPQAPLFEVDDSEEVLNEDYCEIESVDVCNKTPEKQSKPWSNSNSYSYALERFTAKSTVMSDTTKNHTTLLLTKNYRDGDQMTRFQKRKLYGETVRRNLLHQANPMKIPPQVVEVRYVTSIRKSSEVTLATPSEPSAGSLRRHKTCLGLCKNKQDSIETTVEQSEPSVVTLSKSHQSIDTSDPFQPKSSKSKVCYSNNNIKSNDNNTEENKTQENDMNHENCENEKLLATDEIEAGIEEPKKSSPFLSKSSSNRSRDDYMSCCTSRRSLLNPDMSDAKQHSSTNPFVTEENEAIPCIQMISRDQFDCLFEMPMDDTFNDILSENYKFLKKDFSYHAPKVSIAEELNEASAMESQKTSQDSLSRWYHCIDSPYEALTHSNIDEIFRNSKFEAGQFPAYDSKSRERTADLFSGPGSEESGYATAKSKETSAAEKFFQRPSIKALLGTSLSSFGEDRIITRLQQINLDCNDFSDEAFLDDVSSICSMDSCLKSPDYFNPFYEESIEETKVEATEEKCTQGKTKSEEVKSERCIADDKKEVEFDDAIQLEVVPPETIAPSSSSSSIEQCKELERVDSNRDSNIFAETLLNSISECSEIDDEPCEIKSTDGLEKKANIRKNKRSAWMNKIKNMFKIHHKK